MNQFWFFTESVFFRHIESVPICGLQSDSYLISGHCQNSQIRLHSFFTSHVSAHIACSHHSVSAPQSLVKINLEESDNSGRDQWRDEEVSYYRMLARACCPCLWYDCHRNDIIVVILVCMRLKFQLNQFRTTTVFTLELDACHLQSWMWTINTKTSDLTKKIWFVHYCKSCNENKSKMSKKNLSLLTTLTTKW